MADNTPTKPDGNGKPWWLQWWALGLAAIGLAISLSSNFEGMGIGYSPEVVAFHDSKLVPMGLNDFRTTLALTPDKPVMLIVYASWCPYCKRQIMALKALRLRYPETILPIIYLSKDEDLMELSDYLVKRPQMGAENYTAYYIPTDEPDGEALKTALHEEFGLEADRGVPHIAIFDKNRKLVYEAVGLTELPEIVDALKKLL